MLASYLRVRGCREKKCVILVPACGGMDVGRRKVLASYLRVCGCREEKCVSLVPSCGWVSGGEMC